MQSPLQWVSSLSLGLSIWGSSSVSSVWQQKSPGRLPHAEDGSFHHKGSAWPNPSFVFLTAHSHPCSYRTWHSLPPSAGQASALLLQPTLLAHPSARLFTAPCPYPAGSRSVALSKEFLQQSPRALSRRRRQLSACYSSVTMHKRMGLCHEIDDDSFNRNKLNLVI